MESSLHSQVFVCSVCGTRSRCLSLWLSHLRQVHSNETNLNLKCPFYACEAVYSYVNSLYSHVYRKHPEHKSIKASSASIASNTLNESTMHVSLMNSSAMECNMSDMESNVESTMEAITESNMESTMEASTESNTESNMEFTKEGSTESNTGSNTESTMEASTESNKESNVESTMEDLSVEEPIVDISLERKRKSSLFLMQLKEERMLTQVAIDDVVGGCKDVVSHALHLIRSKVKLAPEIDDALEEVSNPFEGLETAYLQDKFITQEMGCIVSNITFISTTLF